MLNRSKSALQLLLCLCMQTALPAFSQRTGPFFPPLMLPAARFKKIELDAIKKAFPAVSLVMRSGVADKETKDLYAPLH